MFLFSHYQVLNLCDNLFIFVISTKLLQCEILIIKKYLFSSDSSFLCYMKIFIVRFSHDIRLAKPGCQFVCIQDIVLHYQINPLNLMKMIIYIFRT